MSILLRHAASTTAPPANYIEDVFSTYLYTGNGSTQTITNGIDLAGKGGMVWIKDRDSGAKGHALFDTARGVNLKLQTPSTNGQFSGANQLTAFNADGFSLGSDADPNGSGTTYVGWTFRNAPKFFHHTTLVKTGGSNATYDFSTLGVLGMVRVKSLASGSWYIWHRSLTAGKLLIGETTAAEATLGHITVSGTTVTLVDAVIADGTYLVEGFAHDAGGFGLTGTDNVISCGSFTTDGSAKATINLGYEPQWLMYRPTNMAESWIMVDTMRGMGFGPNNRLKANTADAEANYGDGTSIPTATGFNIDLSVAGGYFASKPFIYIAIRRGQMKVPTLGTSVFQPDLANASVAPLWEAPFPVDFGMYAKRDSTTATFYAGTRLTGTGRLSTWTDTAEVTDSGFKWDYMNGWFNNAFTDSQYLGYSFKRAPSFFDEVCYRGTGTAGQTYNHNLTTAPELMIVKNRSAGYAEDWQCYTPLGPTKFNRLNSTNAIETSTAAWNDTAPTTSVFTVGTDTRVNGSGYNYVAYLFATCAGVSKVGSYTGNGSSQTINCGFGAGARFVLIKRTDSTGDWFVWDTSRGIVAGNDPYLLLNSTAAEVTTNDSIDPDASGFIVNQLAATNINVTSASYIFLAIA